MKNNMFKAFALAAFSAAALGLTACSDFGTCPADPSAITMELPTTFELNGTPTEFTDATLEMPMAVEVRPDKDKNVRSPFDRLLAALKLNERQQGRVAELQEAHKACAKAALEALRAAERALLAKAKAEVEAVKAEVAAGTKTKEEARAAIRGINKSTREALKNLPERAAAREAMKACDDAFLTGLRSILTEDQIAILEKFLADRAARGDRKSDDGKGPRDGDDKGPRDGDKGGNTGGDSTGTGSTGGRGRG
ncbi:MAG: hypothetical protein ACK5BQ_07150 [Ignavibacteria bacterium]|jgi:hypothetical protein